MRDSNFFRGLGANIIPIGIIVIIIVSFGLFLLNYFQLVKLDEFSILIDIGFKIIAGIIGIIWVLNRYYFNRYDIPKISVKGEAFLIQQNDSKQLLSYNIEILNDGNALINQLSYSLSISKYIQENNKLKMVQFYRFPENGLQKSSNIEPHSWLGHSESLLIDSKLDVIEIKMDFEVDNFRKWEWHRIFKL